MSDFDDFMISQAVEKNQVISDLLDRANTAEAALAANDEKWQKVLAQNISTFNANVAAAQDEIERLLTRMGATEMKDHLQTVDERDAAEETLSQAYYLITGNSPHWSNLFGHQEALQDIDDAQRCLRAEIAENAALKAQIATLTAAVKDHSTEAVKLRMIYGEVFSGTIEKSLVRTFNALLAARAKAADAVKEKP